DTAHDGAAATDTPGDSPERRPCPGSPPAGALPSGVGAMPGVVVPELKELPLEISRGPEQEAIQTFAPDGPTSRSTTGWERGMYGTALSSWMLGSAGSPATDETGTADHGPHG